MRLSDNTHYYLSTYHFRILVISCIVLSFLFILYYFLTFKLKPVLELELMNLVCLICTDDIRSDCSAPKCGHIFHSECLKHWLQLNKSCPQCRAKCSKVGDVIKLFLNAEGESGACLEDASPSIDNDCSPHKLRSRISEYERNLCEKEAELAILREEFFHCKDENESLKVSRTKYEKKYNEEHKIVSQLNKELRSVYSQFDKITDEHNLSSKRCGELESAAKVYRLIQSVLENGRTDIEFLVASYGNGPNAVKSIAQSLFHLKKNYDELKELNNSIRLEKEKSIQEMRDLEKKYSRKSQELENLRCKFQKLKHSLICNEVKFTKNSPPQLEFSKSKPKRAKISPDNSPDPLKMELEKSTRIPFTDKESPNVAATTLSSPEKKPELATAHKMNLPLNLRHNYKKFSLMDHSNKRKLSQKSSFNPSNFCFEKRII